MSETEMRRMFERVLAKYPWPPEFGENAQADADYLAGLAP